MLSKRLHYVTLSQECPRNSFTEAAFWAYIKGETQKPQIHHFGILSATVIKKKKNKLMKTSATNHVDIAKWQVLPLEMMNPPRAMTTSIAKDPKVLATIIFLPNDPITRKRPIDIWCRKKYNKSCRENLQ